LHGVVILILEYRGRKFGLLISEYYFKITIDFEDEKIFIPANRLNLFDK
jgi:hypothetical protein